MNTQSIIITIAGLFLAQVAYTTWLFHSFRRKIYLDMMDFVISRIRREAEDDDMDPTPRRRRTVRLAS